MFVLSLKEPIFSRIRTRFARDAGGLADANWEATQLVDSLGLFTAEMYQKGRDQIILKQQEEMLELSTPVITLWEGILALPLIGTLDSARTQIVMENLLQRVVETGSTLAIIDITGVPTVDTLTAQHLLKTVAAARLMGADCIISGIRPQIAQTIVHLGVELGDVITKATLADAFAIALRRRGLAVQRRDVNAAARAVAPSRQPMAVPRARRSSRGTHSHSQDGRLPPCHDPGRHARSHRHDAAGRSHGPDREPSIEGGTDRYLFTRDGGLVHRPHVREHRGDVPCARRRDRRRRHAPRRRHYARRARHAAQGVRTALNVEKGMALLQASPRRTIETMPSASETLALRSSEDVVIARQYVRARAIEQGFSLVDQTKLVTAASELARNTLRYGGGGMMHVEVLNDGARRGVRLVSKIRAPVLQIFPSR